MKIFLIAPVLFFVNLGSAIADSQSLKLQCERTYTRVGSSDDQINAPKTQSFDLQCDSSKCLVKDLRLNIHSADIKGKLFVSGTKAYFGPVELKKNGNELLPKYESGEMGLEFLTGGKVLLRWANHNYSGFAPNGGVFSCSPVSVR